MTSPRPDDPNWLSDVVNRSPLLPDADLRAHWRRVIPWLRPDQRYELAACLLWFEQLPSTLPGAAG